MRALWRPQVVGMRGVRRSRHPWSLRGSALNVSRWCSSGCTTRVRRSLRITPAGRLRCGHTGSGWCMCRWLCLFLGSPVSLHGKRFYASWQWHIVKVCSTRGTVLLPPNRWCSLMWLRWCPLSGCRCLPCTMNLLKAPQGTMWRRHAIGIDEVTRAAIQRSFRRCALGGT